MPELPEITHLAEQMHIHLTGKTILSLDALNPKCLNLPPEEFQAAVGEATLEGTHAHGKWIFTRTTRGWLLLNLNMGGEVLLVTPTSLPEKRRLVINFSDGTCLSLNFWWMGFLHYVALDGLASHTSTAKLGPNALELSEQELAQRLKGRRGNIKAFLLDQAALAGIGNAYVHDILFFCASASAAQN
jgi:formamidopyrimidine-DNA glycosylase